ncbi:hypothetical protein ONZ43_g5998 [Nemania bipapillata]|uniref:Uncharacterized protein n=1 Tax=Nemania bipapillata TaxID=110536 RepID=A0ACC2I5C2_9PEZI|nr:hypothetical protein ONZ43_g5998 [Nemania bipapillata]
MESWEGYNYYTRNPVIWVQLMDLSTAEFGLGSFPDLCAIPKNPDAPAPIPCDATFVIKDAGLDEFDNGVTAGIVFGVITAAVLIAASIWLWFNRKTIFHPLNSNNRVLAPLAGGDAHRNAEAVELMPHIDQICEATKFKEQLFRYYYERTTTEVELAEKAANSIIEVDDVEAMTELVRRMYSCDLELYANQHVRDYENERSDLMVKSDKILGAIRDKVLKDWASDPGGRVRWRNEDWDQVSALKRFLERELRDPRYSNSISTGPHHHPLDQRHGNTLTSRLTRR